MTRSFRKTLSAVLTGALLIGTASSAFAGPRHWRSDYHHRHYRNNGAIVLGAGLFALGALAIIASQNSRREGVYYRYGDEYYAPPPPPRDYYYRDYGPPPPPGYYDEY